MYAWSFEVDLLHLKYVIKNWWFVNFIPTTWPSLWRHLLPSFQIWYSWYKFQLQPYLEVEKPGSIQSPVHLLFHKRSIWSRSRIASWDIIGRKVKVFIALETFWYISKCKKRIWRLWLKNDKISLEFNQKNNDLIYQIITSSLKDIPKEIRTFSIQFHGTKVTFKIWQYFAPNFAFISLKFWL